MDWLLLIPITMIAFSVSGMIHFHGYKMGRKVGFKLGKEKINEYALKINQAQNERIKELQDQRTGEINKLARFFTGDIEK